MRGAIIGDIVGSRFEFDNIKTKTFDLFSADCTFTDDSVMTLAVAKALCESNLKDIEGLKKHLVKTMHELGKKYPHCGFGGKFYRWIMCDETKPYNSFGNGSAMRVSAASWYASSLEETETLAKASAEVTHNHPEGIKGAVCTAGLIYLARTGADMKAMKDYAQRFYNIDFTLDEIRDSYGFYEICQKSVPQAIVSFFESKDFEDAIRNAVSIGGDSDTIAAIAGSIAEAYYGIPDDIFEKAEQFLDDFLISILHHCESELKCRAKC